MKGNFSLGAAALLLGLLLPCPAAYGQGSINLDRGWQVLQDVHGMGEKLSLWRRNSHDFGKNTEISDWEPLPRLAHLQLLFAPQPYFGRELRYFNQAPWWYRLEFPTPEGCRHAVLRFEGVDYYAKVWLNETLLGEHEGYSNPFEFEVGPLLTGDKPNVLTVKVSSPWDTETLAGQETNRVHFVIRSMMKGTYEHADTFVQRDVNPIGIWRPVRLLVHDGLRAAAEPAITTKLEPGPGKAVVSVAWPVSLEGEEAQGELTLRIRSVTDGAEVARVSRTVRLKAGTNELAVDAPVVSPRLWSTWDRGGPALYRAELQVRSPAHAVNASVTFGIRDIELRRSARETTFLLNGKPLYLRGATYWPDIYISNVDRGRYERDVAAAVRAGINALRIHVHVENPEFYEICDRMGIVLLQDSDLNWVFPADEQFSARARRIFGDMIRELRNHPSIICWIAMNEAKGEHAIQQLGPELIADARRLDPTRPTIRNSESSDDLESGDGHDYRGSLGRGHYTDIYGSTEKLSTEFGVDAPPAADRLRLIPQAAEKLKDVLPRVAELHDYQYRLIKYYVEHYRMQKYAPNSGYFLFMFIDFSPQSFYGIYDYWGAPKSEGIGGGLRALEESNNPVGIFMEYKNAPVAVHVVNDTLTDFGRCTARWRVTTETGEDVLRGDAPVKVGPDSHARAADLSFSPHTDVAYRIVLQLTGPDGKELAQNIYRDPFHHPPHPKGHPVRMDAEMGMRLWWAGEGN